MIRKELIVTLFSWERKKMGREVRDRTGIVLKSVWLFDSLCWDVLDFTVINLKKKKNWKRRKNIYSVWCIVRLHSFIIISFFFFVLLTYPWPFDHHVLISHNSIYFHYVITFILAFLSPPLSPFSSFPVDVHYHIILSFFIVKVDYCFYLFLYFLMTVYSVYVPP